MGFKNFWYNKIGRNILRILGFSVDNYRKNIDSILRSIDRINSLLENYSLIEKNLRNNNDRLEMIEQLNQYYSLRIEDLATVEDNLRGINMRMQELDLLHKELNMLSVNVRNNNQQLEKMKLIEENLKNNNLQLEKLTLVEENLKNNNLQLEKLKLIEENLNNINQQMVGIDSIVENLRNNNGAIDSINTRLDMLSVKTMKLEQGERRVVKPENEAYVNNCMMQDMINSVRVGANTYEGIDYFDFENYFRGSRASIKKNQEIYVGYFIQQKNVLDLGCGRGEFLELLKDNDVEALGIDMYQEFVDLCVSKGLNAECGDALQWLSKTDNVGGIFAGQLVEHLSIEQVISLCELAYEKMNKGAYLVLETPNPTSLAIYTHAFYMDPSHQKPIHPLTLKYLVEKAGFHEVQVVYTKSSRLPVKIPKMKKFGDQWEREFNEAMQIIEETLFGSQDYAIVAKK